MENEIVNNTSGPVDLTEINEQFNAQRARMKELYLHKEKECMQLKQKMSTLQKEMDEWQSKLTVAEYNYQKDVENSHNELQTLQQIIQETCDESTLANNEIKRLMDDNERLKQEVIGLREQQQQQESNKSLDPILSQLGLKTLARNVKKIAGNNSSSQENLEKVAPPTSKYAQEDADTLRSLVAHLEDEIQQLKEKLRAAYDEQVKGENIKPKSALVGLLNAAQKPDDAGSNDESAAELENACSMCKNYEIQLVQAQDSIETEKQKTVKVEKLIDRLKHDLMKESALRLDLEKTWQEKREEHREEVQSLCDKLNESERRVLELQTEFCNFKDDINRELLKLVEERREIHEHLDTLQKDNDYLSGRYLAHSDDLKDQEINLPQSIDELQELVLGLHENLIVSKVGQEFNEAKCISFRDESNLLRDQLHHKEKERVFIEQKLNSQIHVFEEKLRSNHQTNLKLIGEKEEMQKIENDNKKEISDLRMQNIELSGNVDRLEKTNMDLKTKGSMMQQELQTSEAVQKDFVKLSQSLQMQLEKIRSADTQVRWQDEDDVYQCPTCKLDFTVTRRKRNCRHCGTIFCESCCNRVVKSGNSKRPARVCDLCHTLLEQNTAPYFSQTAPQSP